MKVFITGGAGFGGSGLTKELLKLGHEVTCLDILSPNHADNLREEIDKGLITYIWQAVQDVTPETFKGYDIVCHFAAQADVPMGFPSPRWTAWENVIGTVCVLEALRDNKTVTKVLIPSSGNVIGRPLKVPIDETHPCTPHNPYAASKACQEMYGNAYRLSYGVPVVTFRNGIVYGQGMRKDIFLYIWIKNIIQGKPIVIEGGDQTRDPSHVSDTVQAWLNAIIADPKDVVGETFQVSTGKEYSINYLADKVVEIAQEKGFDNVLAEHKDYRPGEKGQREVFDVSKAERVLGYKAKVNIEDGIRDLFDWMMGLDKV